MKYLSLVLLGILLSAEARADLLGGAVEIAPAPGWAQGEPRKGRSLPPSVATASYNPKDGRNATVLFTLFPGEFLEVSDTATLKKLNRMASRPFLPSPNAEVPLTEFTCPHGSGVYANFEDPDLVGKPSQKGNYKFATVVTVLLSGGWTLQATILTDGLALPEFNEALEIIQSAAPRRSAAIAAKSGERPTIALPSLGAVLTLPPGFQATPTLNSDPGYFAFTDKTGEVILSGWLDRAAAFRGMKEFWAREKAALVGDAGAKLAHETFKTVNGWEAVFYTVNVKGMPAQKNIRACRVQGNTWVDVHLSILAAESTWKELEDVLGALSLEPK
jgi:hypothetical protein